MKPAVIAFAIFLTACSSGAKKPHSATRQTADTRYRLSPAAKEQLEFESPAIVEPPYGLQKIHSLLALLPETMDANYTRALSPKIYKSLSFHEKFTYNMIHPEAWSQICSILSTRDSPTNRIYSYLPPHLFFEYNWSQRQIGFFQDNRRQVVNLMKEVTAKVGYVGANFRAVIVEINAVEMIRDLVESAMKATKEHYDLTTLTLLMQQNKYSAYLGSPIRGKLNDYVKFTQADQDSIIQLATRFYHGLATK